MSINQTQRNLAHGYLIRAARLRKNEDGVDWETNREKLAKADELERRANEILAADDAR